MDAEALRGDLSQLDLVLDGLEESLQPLLQHSVSATASKIPLLDKAKLYTLTTYAIESLIFSCIRLNGQDAKDHAIFKELGRVKQYFDKIKSVEDAGVGPTTKLDKGASQRIIKHALAGKDRAGHRNTAVWAGSKRKLDDGGDHADDSPANESAQATSVDDLINEGQKLATKAARKAERKANRQGKKSKTKP